MQNGRSLQLRMFHDRQTIVIDGMDQLESVSLGEQGGDWIPDNCCELFEPIRKHGA